MKEHWDIQMLRVDWRLTKAQEREAILRPLARLIARRLLSEGLAKRENADQTMDLRRREVTA